MLRQETESKPAQQSTIGIKVAVIGPHKSGKTCIFNRLIYDEFGKTSMTIGSYFGQKPFRKDDININLCIWDTAGHEKFDSLVNFYCRNAHALVYVFDGENLSEDQIDPAFGLISGKLLEANHDASVHFVVNKNDLIEKQGRQEQLSRFLKTLEQKKSELGRKTEITVCSAKEGTGVQEVFDKVATTAAKAYKEHLEAKKTASALKLQPLKTRISQKQDQIQAMIARLRQPSVFFQDRRREKITYLTNLNNQLTTALREDKLDETTLVRCCRAAMGNSTLAQKELILAGFWNHRVVDFLNEIDRSIVTQVQASIRTNKL
ncbi:MAG: Rab family GTPase [Gammaproteobacteria bacterium]